MAKQFKRTMTAYIPFEKDEVELEKSQSINYSTPLMKRRNTVFDKERMESLKK